MAAATDRTDGWPAGPRGSTEETVLDWVQWAGEQTASGTVGSRLAVGGLQAALALATYDRPQALSLAARGWQELQRRARYAAGQTRIWCRAAAPTEPAVAGGRTPVSPRVRQAASGARLQQPSPGHL